MGLLVPAEPVLDRRASRGQLDAGRQRVGSKQVQGLQQDLAAALELAKRAQRPRERDPHVDLPLAVLTRQQPQRRLEPVGGGGRSPRGCRRTRLEEQRDGLLVARTRVLLHVVGALGGLGASRGQRRRGARVRRESPAARHRLDDRAAHQWVAEDEPTRHRGRAHEIPCEERVERREALGP
jgi:hypothetical protein